MAAGTGYGIVPLASTIGMLLTSDVRSNLGDSSSVDHSPLEPVLGYSLPVAPGELAGPLRPCVVGAV
eukprot:5416721-Amphidinium_carterae.1